MQNITDRQSEIIHALDSLTSTFSGEHNPLLCRPYEEIANPADLILKKYKESDENQKNDIAKTIIDKAKESRAYLKIYLLSVLIKLKPEIEHLQETYEAIINSNLSTNEKFFAYYQLTSHSFRGLSKGGTTKHIELYRKILSEFNLNLKEKISYIPLELRNENLVVVFTSQLLGLNHAPTKTALDRCRVLKKFLGKEVILLNTAELLPRNGAFPWFDMGFSNRSEFNYDSIEYKDSVFRFCQMSNMMPNLAEMSEIINIINQLKPLLTISIGDNLVGDICSQIVPNAVISTVFSSISTTPSQFRITGRAVTEEEKINLEALGISRDSIIESTFTFDFKPQKTKLNRKILGIPEDKFVIALVGGRLTDELTHDFIVELSRIFKEDIHFVIIGIFEKYQYYCEKFHGFKENFTNLGFQDDVLAVLEVCNLYLNPPRTGGGSSAAEALFKGIPVVTLNKGDVATAVGDNFTYNTVPCMLKAVEKYQSDREFYQQQAEIGKERANILLDSDTAFANVFHLIQSHPLLDQPWKIQFE